MNNNAIKLIGKSGCSIILAGSYVILGNLANKSAKEASTKTLNNLYMGFKNIKRNFREKVGSH
jgi:hypothetical protein